MHPFTETAEAIRQDPEDKLWEEIDSTLEEPTATRREVALGLGVVMSPAAIYQGQAMAKEYELLRNYDEVDLGEIEGNMSSLDGENFKLTAKKNYHESEIEGLVLGGSSNQVEAEDTYTLVEFVGEHGQTIYGVAKGAYTPESAGNVSSSRFTDTDLQHEADVHIGENGMYNVAGQIDEVEDTPADEDLDVSVGDYVLEIDMMKPVE